MRRPLERATKRPLAAGGSPGPRIAPGVGRVVEEQAAAERLNEPASPPREALA